MVLEAQYMIAGDRRAGVVRMVVKTDNDANPHYEFDVIVAATISVEDGAENMSIEEYALGGSGRALLYPFAREAVANLTGRGRFGPLWLHPFNFIALGEPSQVTDTPTPAIAEGGVTKSKKKPVKKPVRR